jgi:hypothetical protein
METEKSADILVVFRIMEIEVILGKPPIQGALQLMPREIVGNDGDFVYATCILCAGQLENFKIVVRV